MTALCIIFLILLLLFFIAIIPVSLTLKYDSEISVFTTILGLKITLYPKRKKKVKISDYSLKKTRRRQKKELKKAAKSTQTKVKRTGTSQKRSLLEDVELIYKLLKKLASEVSHHVKIKTKRIILNVASDDAAKTAILYAAVNNAVLLILTLLDNFEKLEKARRSEIAVNADFLSAKSSADIELSFSLRIWQLIKILFATALEYVTQKLK